MPLRSKRNDTKSSSKKTIVQRKVTAKAPTSSSCELPILKILSSAKDHQLSAREVIVEILSNGDWFDDLTEDDLQARYPNSRRKIVETRIKFARKNLTLKNQLYPCDETRDHPLGIWQIADDGLDRLKKNGDEEWKPKYSVLEDAIILLEIG